MKNVVITVLAVLVLGLGGYLVYDKVVDKKDKNVENTQNVNKSSDTEKVQKSLYSFLAYDKDGIVGVSEHGETSKIVSGSEKFYLDGKMLYWIDNTSYDTCNGEHNLYRVNITDKENIENLNIKLDMCRTGFSVVGDNLYYFSKINNKIVAVTQNLKTGASSKNEINVKTIMDPNFDSGNIVYFTDLENVSDVSSYYSYNFDNNELIKLEKYNTYSYGYNNNYYYTLKENKGDSLLFASLNNEYCVYNAKEGKESYCVDIKKYGIDKINKGYADSIVATLKGNNIIFMADDSIIECSNESKCESIYDLTEEEAAYDYKFVLYFSNKLVLGLAKKDGGYLTYDYTYYDLLNNKKEMKIPYYANHANSELYFVK